jgi:SSS family solute:Na+ symporter
VNLYLWVILAYLLALTAFNLYKSRQVKTQDDFMVAGRNLSLTKMVFTLVCTWIGSGTFIAGAEYAYYAGWSAVWQPAGAFLGIAIIYFVAAKIRTFGQYTVGDILEVRYGKFARLFGAIALIIAFTTIVSYQFRAGGYILNIVTDGQVSLETGQAIAAGFVILFVAIGGMVAVAHTDLPNGIIIVSACLIAFPFVVAATGSLGSASHLLPPSHFQVFASDFGKYGAQGARLLPLDPAASAGRAVDVPEVLRRAVAARCKAGGIDLDRRHDPGRDDRHCYRRVRFSVRLCP